VLFPEEKSLPMSASDSGCDDVHGGRLRVFLPMELEEGFGNDLWALAGDGQEVKWALHTRRCS
jgi:hypothetical protein